jgi:hypothetical protein
MAFATWSAELPVTAVDEVAGTFTVATADPMLIVMGPANLASALEVTVTMAADNPLPVHVGSTVRLRIQATVS